MIAMEESQKVFVIGPNLLLNQLIVFAIRRELGEDVQTEITQQMPVLPPSEKPALLLVDDSTRESKARLREMVEPDGGRNPAVIGALFNVDPVRHEVYDAVRSGVRGIFYSSIQIPDMMMGLRTLLDGTISIPMEILVDLVMNGPHGEKSRVDQKELTRREMEILSCVRKGASNDEIASQLFISPHTVKSHMYNIFRKIGVSNRLHATLWAVQNLSVPDGTPRL